MMMMMMMMMMMECSSHPLVNWKVELKEIDKTFVMSTAANGISVSTAMFPMFKSKNLEPKS